MGVLACNIIWLKQKVGNDWQCMKYIEKTPSSQSNDVNFGVGCVYVHAYVLCVYIEDQCIKSLLVKP